MINLVAAECRLINVVAICVILTTKLFLTALKTARNIGHQHRQPKTDWKRYIEYLRGSTTDPISSQQRGKITHLSPY